MQQNILDLLTYGIYFFNILKREIKEILFRIIKYVIFQTNEFIKKLKTKKFIEMK